MEETSTVITRPLCPRKASLVTLSKLRSCITYKTCDETRGELPRARFQYHYGYAVLKSNAHTNQHIVEHRAFRTVTCDIVVVKVLASATWNSSEKEEEEEDRFPAFRGTHRPFGMS